MIRTQWVEDRSEVFLSVVTVCRNNLQGLIKTWQSVKSQSCSLEWIVVDGNSDDGTLAFLQNIEDERVSFVSEPDQGIYDAMNKGLECCNGQYVVFMNSGDRFYDDTIGERLRMQAIQHHLPDLLYGDALEEARSGELLYKTARSHKRMWYGMFTHHQSMAFRRGSLSSIRYRLEYPIGADYALTAELLLQGGTAAYLRKPICIFEQGGISQTQHKQGQRDQWFIRKTILGMPIVLRASIALLQWGVRLVKHSFPKFYKRVRFSYEK
ncbi:colanic acid biosynthesis glycosyltransferase WcaE [Paenibacillus lautus]|uniref:glycosyltransferase family 2 protein n=1 Tax=Paenibacillus lautus TaxID=1401 RepID=UPI001B2835F1|nr:glycosyltransferase family 2 protein [Paenibacillus lautus]GIP05298.1 colanic acid biosynthesis glycosyltransferase WcaE [Paenibacillus lautus]